MHASKRGLEVILPDLNLKRRRLTRYQERQSRSVFRFFDLPAELRIIIYEYCTDITATQHILQRYYDKLRDCTDTRKIKAPLVWVKAPTIFLINRQIFAESSVLVRKRSLTFDHGLLDLLDVTDFIPPSLFGNVSSITIDDSGHPLFKENILAASWIGYTTLIQQLADILSRGHQLKSFTLSFADQELIPHITMCWNAQHHCGFRDSLRKACDTLRSVRNVGFVTLRGLSEPLATQLKARMESTPINFLNLPAEIRNLIYAESLDWSDTSVQLARTMDRWVNKRSLPPYPTRSTSTILLLNRQIAGEALQILRKKPLTIACPRDHNLHRQAQVPNMIKFISATTLKQVEHLVLELHSWEWIYSLDHFLPAFASSTTTAVKTPAPPTSSSNANNTNACPIHSPATSTSSPMPSFSPALKTIHVHFSDTLKSRFLAEPMQHYPDHTLHTSLSHLSDIRGLEKVTFGGDLPACYTVPLTQIMQTPVHAGAVALPSLMAIKGNGEVVDVDDD